MNGFDPKFDFKCQCIVPNHKNVWNDIVGCQTRYCTVCGETWDRFYEPTVLWEETGRGRAGEAEPAHLVEARDKAALKRGAKKEHSEKRIK